MTPKEIIDIARRLTFCSPRWDELYAQADADTREELERIEHRAYHREEYAYNTI